ncbi:MAG TPA: amino acid permease [bacterium]|nr:amino acid permease [bacterium]
MSPRAYQRTVELTSSKARFGTFAGVFTPNVLTILGIIFFLRTGWVVGQTGLIHALIIVAVANGISLLTGLSMASVSTSMEVKVGGTYYIISRALGLEIGGAIGIPLYLSQAISVAFYIIGFTEAFLVVFPVMSPRMLATILVLLFGVLAYFGADFVLRIQFGILAILALAIVSFFLGGWGSSIQPAMLPPEVSDVTFWGAFAVFFPAVTGIAIGVSMSGDLKDPTRSIPRGTLASILVTSVIYLVATVWLATHATPEELISEHLIMQQIARWPVFILLGVWAATLSSALGSVLAAPRTLQALSFDRVLPRIFSGQLRSLTEPRVAVIVTTAIALSIVWMGGLNFVAAVISMFFLNTYGMINLTAGLERLAGNPSFRPKFRVPYTVSLLGAAGCYGAMFLINWIATIVAIVISFGVFFILERRSLQRTWGDIRSGLWFAVTRYGLLNLEERELRSKNWRPNLVVFTGQPYNREQLVEVSEWLSKGQGVVTFFQLLVGDVEELSAQGYKEAAKKHIRKYIQERKMAAFAESEIVPDFYHGALTVVQAHGLGGFIPNTVLLGWSNKLENIALQLQLMRSMIFLRKSVLFLNHDPDRSFGQRRTIDVWWGGRGKNAELMLILSHLITRHRSWHGAQIRVLRVIDSAEGREHAREHIAQMLEEARVDAEPVVLVKDPTGRSLAAQIQEQSRESDLTFLGMQFPDKDECEEYGRYLNQLVQSVGSVILVRSAQIEDVLDTG